MTASSETWRRFLRVHAPLIAIVALAALLRFATLDLQSFWLDESYTLEDLSLNLGAMLAHIRDHESSPPLYFLLAWFWVKLFGTGEVGLRALSALFGTATVPIAYAAASSLASRRAGLMTAGLVAVSPFLVWYSQEARPYALLIALGALSFLFFVRALDDDRPVWLVLWAAASSLALATHFFAVFLIVAEAAYLSITLRTRRVAVAIGAVAAVGAGLLPLALGGTSHYGIGWIHRIALSFRLSQVPSQFLGGAWEADLGPKLIFAVAIAVGVAALALVMTRADAGERRAARICALIAAASLAAPLALTLAGRDYLNARNVGASWLPLAILIVTGLGARRAGRAGALLFASVVCTLTAATVSIALRPGLQRQDWRSVARVLGAPSGSRATFVPAAGQPLRRYLSGDPVPLRGPQVHVTELAIVGTRAEHRYACWWGGVCDLPPAMIPSDRAPAVGFRRVSRTTTDRFTIVRFQASRPVSIRLRSGEYYGRHNRVPWLVFLQRRGA